MILSAQTIRSLCTSKWIDPIVSPFNERTRNNGVTYGLSPAGYDVRIEFDKEGDQSERWLWRGEFLLASTIEKFKMPDDIMGIVHDKSTWARRGLAVQNTVIEPGWEGYLTLELTNHGPETLKIPMGAGIAQIVFHRLDSITLHPYEGKYQNQERGPVKGKDDVS